MNPLEIICNDPTMQLIAADCSKFLSLPLVKTLNKKQYLEFDNGLINIISIGEKETLSFTHSFHQSTITRRLESQDQHILKAFKSKQNTINTILDTTAGWCRDSFILAQNNFNVTAIEQEKLIYFLSQYSLQQFKAEHDIHLELVHQNSVNFLKQHNVMFDAIYLDPMFPVAKKQHAKNKKEIQLLQAMTHNLDITELFQLTLEKASQRVVVKRPLHSEYLNNLKPNFQYKGKTIRFDIYQCF